MSSNSTQPVVTSNNFGPAVNVITWFLGSTVVLFVIARLVTKIVLAQRIRIDDGFLMLALVRMKEKRREREQALLIAPKALQHRPCSHCIAGDNAWWSRSTQVDFITDEAHGVSKGTKIHHAKEEHQLMTP